MKKLITPLVAALLLSVGVAAPAHAAKVGRCEDEKNVNLRLCASINYADGNVWATGSGNELFNTALGKYTISGALQRQRCSGGDWQNLASHSDTGNDRLSVITSTFRHQKGYRYRAFTFSIKGIDVGAVLSPAFSRCG